MITSWDADVAALEAGARELTGRDVEIIEQVHGGRNSRVYRARAGHDEVALKVYFRHEGDPRDRLATEYGAMRLCWDGGLRCAPRPIASDASRGLGLYEFIQGERAIARPATESDVTSLVAFLRALQALRPAAGRAGVASASEACFSLDALKANLRSRIERLRRVPATLDTEEMREFLETHLLPFVDLALPRADEDLRLRGLGPGDLLPHDRRILSPSDVGLHNAVRRRDDSLVFLDFEYFGWDDPAKTACDVILHPGMSLAPSMRKRFLDEFCLAQDADPGLAARVGVLYPLYGIKWCLILLNEFVPQDLARRGFAAIPSGDVRSLQQAQLAKSRSLLERIRDSYGVFPDRS